MSGPSAARHSITVLCIEDEEELRLDLVEELQDAGFLVTGVDSAEAGLELLSAQAFSIILCDIRLPGLSGLDVLKQVRQKHSDHSLVPFIVLSAYDDPPLRCSLRSHGASAFLIKPVDYRNVVDQILALAGLTDRSPQA